MNAGAYIQYAVNREGHPFAWDWAQDAETLRPGLRYLDSFPDNTSGTFIAYPDGRIEHPDGRIESPSNEKSAGTDASEKTL